MPCRDGPWAARTSLSNCARTRSSFAMGAAAAASLPLVKDLAPHDGVVHPRGPDLVLRDREDVLGEDHDVGELPRAQRALRALLEGRIGRVQGVGPERLRPGLALVGLE